MSGETRTRRPSRPRVVILGGGFAGLSAARALRADRYEVVLIDRSRFFEWLPNIHELLSGVKTPELLRLPLADLVSRAGHRFVRDSVTRIDADERLVSLQRRRRPVSYDALIVALGGVDSTRGVTVENARPFKSVESCERIGRRLARLAARRKPGRVVIVGGGLEGVEALGEILRRYRESPLRITLVEAGPRLLPEAAPALDRELRALCAPHAVALETGHAVRRIEAQAVVLDDGRSLPSDLTIWTGGPAPPALLAESGLAPAGAWAPVDATLQSKGHPEVFVAGDAAELPTGLAKQAYHALDMGACAARNVERRLADRSLYPLQPSNKPMLISFGDLSCFLAAGSFVLAGPALGALKEAIFEVGMTQLDAKPVPLRLPGVTRRAARATRCLLWPTLASPTALLRQARLSILSSR
jgi:NADH dehydrogenase